MLELLARDRRGAAPWRSQSSSAACRVGTTMKASVARVRSLRDDDEPAVAAVLEAGELHDPLMTLHATFRT